MQNSDTVAMKFEMLYCQSNAQKKEKRKSHIKKTNPIPVQRNFYVGLMDV